jgi:hypothetical protein
MMVAMVAGWAWAADAARMGVVQYVEGKVTHSRDGKDLGALDIGDDLVSGDLLVTAQDGRLVIELDKACGMQGTLSVNPSSSLYLNLDLVKGEKRTTIDLLTGSVGAKVKKIAGSPSMQVQTATAIAGVRGTEFEVATSVNDAVLVTCSEGEVALDDGSGGALPVTAGKALEKRGSDRPRYLDADPAAIREFRSRWLTEEIAAFKGNPLKALTVFEKRYSDLSAAFKKAFDPFERSAVLRKWIDEDRAGIKPRALDPRVMREKKDLFAPMRDLKRTLFQFERVYFRIDQLYDLVKGTDIEAKELRPGLTVGAFFQRFEAEKAALAGRLGLFHYAQRLFAQRDDGSTDLFGSDFTGLGKRP